MTTFERTEDAYKLRNKKENGSHVSDAQSGILPKDGGHSIAPKTTSANAASASP